MYGKLLILAVGVGIGYVLGARAGRPAYDRLVGSARAVWRDPRVQEGVDKAQDLVREVPKVGGPVADAIDTVKP